MDLKEAFRLMGIPDEILRAYQNKGMTSLYAWQAECLMSTNVLRGDNLLYCAPTSGGKTIVAELILLKTALVLKQQVILVLPYVSLVLEKENYLKKLVTGFNRSNGLLDRVRVRSYYGGKAIKHGKRANIMVCTIEKANSLVNFMLERGRLKDLGCVVVDEAHVISNSLNGYMLEILIAKIKYVNGNDSLRFRLKVPRPIQLIAMSATVGNVESISNWLSSRLYISTYRPVPLYEYIKVGKDVLDLAGRVVMHVGESHPRDPDGISSLCKEAIDRGQQVLVFCATKAQCASVCRMIAEVLTLTATDETVAEQRRSAVLDIERLEHGKPSSFIDLKAAILRGVAYHNSNLDQDVREVVETAYRSGLVQVLVATTTLAVGVNLPAGRVIITSMMLGRDPLTVGHYKQMVGRAGRAGHCHFGDAFLVAKKAEVATALALTQQALPNVESALGPARDGGNALLRMIIEACGLGLVDTVGGIVTLVGQSLFFHLITTPHKPSMLRRLVTAALKFLSGIDTDEGIIVYDGLYRAQQGLFLDSPLHLLFVIAPFSHPMTPNYVKLASFFDKAARSTTNSDAEVMAAIGIDFGQLSKWLAKPPSYLDVRHAAQWLREGFIHSFTEICREAMLPMPGDEGAQEATTTTTVIGPGAPPRRRLSFAEAKSLCASKRLWCAFILRRVLEGFRLEQVAKEFDCSVIDVENLIRDTRIKLQVTKKLCDEIGWTTISCILTAFASELKFDDAKVVGDLLAIDGMTHKMARILVSNGIATVDQVAQQSPSDLCQYFLLSLGFHLQ
eukprot:gene14634-10464_t